MIKGVIEALPRFHQGLCTGFKRLVRSSASAGVTNFRAWGLMDEASTARLVRGLEAAASCRASVWRRFIPGSQVSDPALHLTTSLPRAEAPFGTKAFQDPVAGWHGLTGLQVGASRLAWRSAFLLALPEPSIVQMSKNPTVLASAWSTSP